MSFVTHAEFVISGESKLLNLWRLPNTQVGIRNNGSIRYDRHTQLCFRKQTIIISLRNLIINKSIDMRN